MSQSVPTPRQRLVPRNFHDPFGLAMRLLRLRDPAANFAMFSTLLAAAMKPLDRVLALAEARRYAAATPPRRPIVLVVGAPRSGTTLLAQTLANHLPVSYFTNLTAIFPRAPITATKWFGQRQRPAAGYESFYGRTAGFGQLNDALHLWDRWLGGDRYAVPERLDPAAQDAMRRFFGAYEAAFGLPILNKNNALATRVEIVAEVLPTVHVLCAWREPAFAVQSILTARRVIQGDAALPYGVADPRYTHGADAAPDPIESVCAQVLYHERRMLAQQKSLGPARYTIVPYEAFCETPHETVAAVARDVLGVPVDLDALRQALPTFGSRNRIRDPKEHARIAATLERLRAATG